ncbi:Rpn family recombination-promoting nuclease/putative transposase [Spirosoma sp. KCTC 42546]|uniref:Rpn family recombination-promoting nuclease/putative transposase n=1 Tax=Spirosoma sp. KCTC 42546 TaxID=2520506 RepID=UPI00115BDFA9|nr:Rpn family recombination-promoting nuclease/putative transposase [Spirosoma sp. KCTC 42546]QDK81704.1 Rpn family recombination-promoting nuclease/putative transposase [Spirosoma sp. KCTC 42546]
MEIPEISEQRFIPIISDYGFKATFGNEANTLFLRTSLQALIKSSVPINDVQFEKNAFEALTVDSRSGIYDLACTDEQGNQFIVEMQLAHAPNFIQRMKFYALHKFNTLVERGQFNYSNLPKIYCIAFLEKSILPITSYHTIANLRSESGELIDSQMSFITVELAKFDKDTADIQTDLEKLIFTMKTLHTVTEPTQYPAFWNEEWLKKAIDELDTRKMSPEERFQFARITAINAEAVNAEKRKIEEMKAEAVKKALIRQKLSIEEIAEDNDVSTDFVLNIQNQLTE